MAIFEPPQGTYTGGSAVLRAVGPDGEWTYDNAENTWVNLKTGEALTPADFAVRAGGKASAAENTQALANAMRGEEEQLTARLARMPVTPPTATVRNPYPPAEIARVQAQKPTPSVMVPPSRQQWQQAMAANPSGAASYLDLAAKVDALRQNYDYNRRIERRMAAGQTRAEAMIAEGIPPGQKWTAGMFPRTAAKQFHVAGQTPGVFDPNVGTFTKIPGIPEAPPKPLRDPVLEKRISLLDSEISKLEDEARLVPAVDPNLQSLLNQKIRMRDELMRRYQASRSVPTAVTATTPPPAVVAPKTAGKVITDKRGKKWIYTGINPNPLTDPNPSNWQEQ